jgi:CRP-like cAMP-binding protein
MIDLLVHLSCFLTFASFWVRDILWLRLFSIASSLVWIGYMASGEGRLIGASLFWNLVFITINTVRVTQLVLEKRGVRLSEEERDLREQLFPHLEPHQFVRLLRAGEWRELPAGAVLMREGDPPASIFLLTRGALVVEKGRQEVARFGPPRFAGELSYLSGSPANATVTAVGPVRCVVWGKDALAALFRRHPTLQFALHAVMTLDVTHKLQER